MRCVFAGTPGVAIPSLEALIDSRHEVVAVVTRPDAPRGRGRTVERSAVASLADERGIPVLSPASPRDPEFAARLRELDPDCCPVVAYGAILPVEILAIPRHGWVNLHFSLLPAWRGAAPVQRAILHGDDITGATTFIIGPGLDDGPVLGTVTEAIRPADTSGDLLGRLADSGAGLLLATLDALEDGSIEAKPQPAEGVSIAPKVSVDEARIRWTDPLIGVDRRIRAMTPEPGAWTMFAEERLIIGPVTVAASGAPEGLVPGEVAPSKAGVWVGTATGAVRLGQVRPAGRKTMDAADWARGLRGEIGSLA
ncbi:MAG: methionyl-tRNA formyltransferase [Actinobacteria bacterium]|uniref:methionyl-tRNA formyltransferase n=1 Tax=freshwater metagenome TaxID=449393 RepID=A0A6J7HPK1_9ZZZZ|nr:methionyl-tRNA formyltransferase [Actinomycetota bacterium]